jgi:putative addiction module killer protein
MVLTEIELSSIRDMIETVQTEEFKKWLKALRDVTAKAKILVRIRRLENGNEGDSAPVGEGISELRIHHGPGYRIYYKKVGKALILLLCGGDKSTQAKDIKKAKALANS